MHAPPVVVWIVLGFSILLFLIPFAVTKRQYVPSLKPHTLLGLFRRYLGQAEEPIAALVICPAILTHLLPALIVWQAASLKPSFLQPFLLILEAFICLAGAAITFLFMSLNDASFSWGGGSSTANFTPIAYLIPLLNLLAAITALAAVFSPTWTAHLLGR